MPLICRGDGKSLSDYKPSQFFDSRKEVQDYITDNKDFGNVASSTCAFVPSELLEKTGNPDFWKIKSDTSTLKDFIVTMLEEEIEHKVESLLDTFVLPDDPAAQRSILKALPWPKAPSTVIIPFDDQRCVAIGTGFYIGNRNVITAGHITHDAKSNFSKFCRDHVVVFDLNKGNLDKIPASKVFQPRRLVLHMYTSSEAGIDMDAFGLRFGLDVARTKTAYDVGIIEIGGLSSGAPLPTSPPLKLLPYLPTKKTPVALVGHGNGLPQKVSSGGQIATIPDAGNTARSTLTLDLDCFKGNSGGPVVTVAKGDDKNGVVGLVRSGPMFPFCINSVTSDLTYNVQINPQLLNEIEDWRRKSGYLAPRNRWGRPLEPADSAQKAKEVVQKDFLACYGELQVFDKGETVAWQRFLPSSVFIDLEMYTRVDAFAYFTKSLQEFSTLQPNRPCGWVQVTLTVSGKYPAANAASREYYTVQIDNGDGMMVESARAEAQKVPLLINEAPGDISLTWNLLNTNLNPNPPQSTLAASLLASPGGIASWRSMKFTRKIDLGSEKTGTIFKPTRGSFKVQFSITNNDTAVPARWSAGTNFYFRNDIGFTNTKDLAEGTHTIGLTFPPTLSNHWVGPITAAEFNQA